MLFAYPERPHIRKHSPSGYEDYRSYKDWLRDEFTFRQPGADRGGVVGRELEAESSQTPRRWSRLLELHEGVCGGYPWVGGNAA
jgi:hypothetical protein